MLTESEGLMKGCEIVLDEGDAPLNVSIDVLKQIKQVILNMVKNAMDAIEEVQEHTGLIRISTATENKFVQISIADNGHGMDHNTLVRLLIHLSRPRRAERGLDFR